MVSLILTGGQKGALPAKQGYFDWERRKISYATFGVTRGRRTAVGQDTHKLSVSWTPEIYLSSKSIREIEKGGK